MKEGAREGNRIINAIGPETFTFRELVSTLGEIIGKRRPLVSIPPVLGLLAGKILGRMVGDVLITREEIRGLMADLLYVDAPAAGVTSLTDWARENRNSLGRRYASELARRRRAPG